MTTTGAPGARGARRPASCDRTSSRKPAATWEPYGALVRQAHDERHGPRRAASARAPALRGLLPRPVRAHAPPRLPAHRLPRRRRGPRAGFVHPAAAALPLARHACRLPAAHGHERLLLVAPPPPTGTGVPAGTARRERARARRDVGRAGQAGAPAAGRARAALLPRSFRGGHRRGARLPARHREVADPPRARGPEGSAAAMNDDELIDRLRDTLHGEASQVHAPSDAWERFQRRAPGAPPARSRWLLAAPVAALGVAAAVVAAVFVSTNTTTKGSSRTEVATPAAGPASTAAASGAVANGAATSAPATVAAPSAAAAQPLLSGFAPKSVTFVSPAEGFVLGTSSIAHTVDGGLTWSPLPAPPDAN